MKVSFMRESFQDEICGGIPEGEYREGTVRLVAALVQEAGPPKVIVEELRYWGVWLDILIVEYCFSVIKDKGPFQ